MNVKRTGKYPFPLHNILKLHHHPHQYQQDEAKFDISSWRGGVRSTLRYLSSEKGICLSPVSSVRVSFSFDDNGLVAIVVRANRGVIKSPVLTMENPDTVGCL